jgi:hypothetical protein
MRDWWRNIRCTIGESGISLLLQAVYCDFEILVYFQKNCYFTPKAFAIRGG